MNDILEQLELNKTFFVQLLIFGAVFLFLSQVYFKPFMKLFEARHQKTIKDREAAERLMSDAKDKLEQYRKLLSDERMNVKKELERAIEQAKREESELLGRARDDAKKITQAALESISSQRDSLRAQLERDVDLFAGAISEKLLSKKP